MKATSALPKIDPKDPRINPTDPAISGSTDDVLKGLITLDKSDLERIQELLTSRSMDLDSVDPIKSPRTAQYLRIVDSLFGRTSAGITLSNSTDDYLNRDKLYEIYDDMDSDCTFVTSALDILSDDAVQPNDDGEVVHVESKNSKVTNLINALFRDLEIDSRISKWARAIAKYGDFFLKVYGSNDDDHPGVSSVEDTTYPSSISRYDFRGKLVAFSHRAGGFDSTNEYIVPWEYIHFRHKGDLAVERTKQNSMLNDQDTSFNSSYGQSILRPAIKAYTQLKFTENMMLLNRLTNSVKRNVFMINTGDLDPRASFEMVKNYSDLLKKDVNLDLDSELYRSSKHIASFDEDIFIPVSDAKNDIHIQEIGGKTDMGDQSDLEYLQNKLFSALKVPKAYLNYEQDLNARSTLIQLDIRYARTVSQLQTTLISGLRRLVDVHLAYLGMDPSLIDYDITLAGVSAIDQEARLEQKTQRIAAARDFWDLVNSVNETLNAAKDQTEESMDTPIGGTGPSMSGFDFGGSGDSESEIPEFDMSDEESEAGSEDLGAELSDLRAETEEVAEEPEPIPASLESSRQIVGSRINEGDDPISHNRTNINIQDRFSQPDSYFHTNRYKSALDLEFLAHKLFTEYLDLPESDTQQILRIRKRTSSEHPHDYEETQDIIMDSRHAFDSDQDESLYPTKQGRMLWESVINSYCESVAASRIDESASTDKNTTASDYDKEDN